MRSRTLERRRDPRGMAPVLRAAPGDKRVDTGVSAAAGAATCFLRGSPSLERGCRARRQKASCLVFETPPHGRGEPEDDAAACGRGLSVSLASSRAGGVLQASMPTWGRAAPFMSPWHVGDALAAT